MKVLNWKEYKICFRIIKRFYGLGFEFIPRSKQWPDVFHTEILIWFVFFGVSICFVTDKYKRGVN